MMTPQVTFSQSQCGPGRSGLRPGPGFLDGKRDDDDGSETGYMEWFLACTPPREPGSPYRADPARPAVGRTRTGQDAGISGRVAKAARDPCVQLLLDGVLDFRSGHLGVALNLVTTPFGLQTRAAGSAAGLLLGAAFNGFGLMRDLLDDTHG